MLYDCYVAASTGVLKGVQFSKSIIKNVNVENVSTLNPALDEITAMCFVKNKEFDLENEILTCHANRLLKLFNSTKSTSKHLLKLNEGDGKIKAVQITSDNSRIITGVESGEISVLDGNLLFQDNEVNQLTDNKSTFCSLNLIKSGNNLSTIQLHPNDNNLLASGGNNNILKIWDLNTGKSTFCAKNVRQDNLELKVPIWETNVRFFGENKQCLVTTTGKSQIRLYDPRLQKKPIKELYWMDLPIYALSTCYQNNQILAGNTRGELGLFDVRNTKISLVCKYKGFAGSIRSIDAHPTKPIFVSCGIDRFLLLHNINTRAILKKMFCKAQLNSVLLCKESSLAIKKEIEIKEQDDLLN